nr:Zn2+/Cd2+-exporting ATPase [Candidatus Cloacimonadota bacterium]
MVIREYEVKNLSCAGCGAKIEEEITNLAEVNSANLDFVNKRLVVQYHEHSENALERINQLASRIEPGVKIYNLGESVKPARSIYSSLIFAGLALWLFVQFAPLSSTISTILLVVSYFLVACRVLKSAVQEVFSRQLMAEHFLMSIASLGAVYLGEFTEAIAVIGLYELGQYLESKAISKSRNSIAGIISLKPDKAHVQTETGTIDKKLSEVTPGEVLIVHPGERIPLDGRVIKGESSLDSSSVSGESTPIAVKPGDEIFAGCLNQGGLIQMQALKIESESMVARILSLIDNASARKSRQERFITRFARVYTPTVVGIAIIVFLLPVLLGYPAAVWFKRALVFLIVSCPCALVISIPLTYYIGIGTAARKGIIFKGSIFLDSLRKVESMVFDKTGTLTTGNLKLEALLPSEGVAEAELAEALWLAEYNSRHPFAQAVKAALSGKHDSSLQGNYSEISGSGIRMEYAGKSYIAGSERFFKEQGYDNLVDCSDNSSVHVAVDGKYLGAAIFKDEIKPSMKQNLKSLRNLGIKTMYMLSGDRSEKVKTVAKDLGLDGYEAELLPGQKLKSLEKIMKNGQYTAYIGDGMNDAPVLTRADIGIAMGAIGAQVSIDTADIVLLNDHPEQLVQAYKLSCATNRKVKQNISLALGIKILVMVLGVAGISGLWEAIIADVGVTLLVIFNSLQLSRVDRMLDKK